MDQLMAETLNNIAPLDETAMAKARDRLDGLLKPPGSLGKLEDLAVQLAGIYGETLPRVRPKGIVMMAADNGVYEEGFHTYPQEITRVVAELAGPGLIGVSVLARHAGCRLLVVDVGIKGEVRGEHILSRKIKNGTGNIVKGPAMTREEAIRAVEVGIEAANFLIESGIGVLGTGEVGICNTTTTAAVLAGLTGVCPQEVVGAGTGGGDEAYRLKLKAVREALAVNRPDGRDPIDVLAKVGGLDLAGLVGCCLAAAARRTAVVIDGFIAGTAALAAVRLNPLVRNYLIPSHLSAEKGARLVLEKLEMEPLLLMNMRLGEGTGAALAFSLIDAACKIINEMGSFADLDSV
ncbi:MAG: nicotinate-nucleotide--dimethylbenzimidazole phosphoribosyltransferase [Peptococcaceae bacterium]|jgi:nicotinate-nucleotide--dimethylbenzimidazole phosphoribosyltransferase|nr:nicotinate-nucleotide--dimethylbenzimidazole phosphoribosyltransferase [Peptococcaceae bacterium]MDH7524189.1 nicotinate-nucleotide--dimethylbenzimidazole phosphoribosyltransferase [Peptococcaceae bacterium]